MTAAVAIAALVAAVVGSGGRVSGGDSVRDGAVVVEYRHQ
jgi:hypothetical protein